MQSESIKSGILSLSKIGLSVSLTVFVLSGCVADSDNANSQRNITQTNESPRQSNAAIVTPDADATPRKNSQQLKFEAIVLDEIRGNWRDDNGNIYTLTKLSEQKMLERLLPEAEKQFELSFAAQNTKIAEEETESNIETTITEIGNNRTVTKRKLFSRGEEKLAVALENIETVSQSIGHSLDNLSLVSESDKNAQANKFTKNSEETVRKILLSVHKYALDTVEKFRQPKSLGNVSANFNKID